MTKQEALEIEQDKEQARIVYQAQLDANGGVPTTPEELIQQAEEDYQANLDLIDSLDD